MGRYSSAEGGIAIRLCIDQARCRVVALRCIVALANVDVGRPPALQMQVRLMVVDN